MFRKPKAKGTTRQRIIASNENEDGEDGVHFAAPSSTKSTKILEDDEELVSAKPPSSLLSFDHDEGADDNFEIKKSKKYLKDQKRQKKLEERAAREAKDEEFDVIEVKKEEPDQEDIQVTFNPSPVENIKENHRLRTTTATRSYKKEEDEEDKNETRLKFSTTYRDIPDSKAVYEARKKREQMRRQGQSGYIPLDDDQKLQSKGERRRLVREDDNDDSDEEQSFYSAKAILKEEEEKRRDAELEMAKQEDGMDEVDEELDEWERMQIEKAVSYRSIGELAYQHNAQRKMMAAYEERYMDNRNEVDMDVEMGDEMIENRGGTRSATDPDKSDPADMEAVLSRLKLRINDREEALNTRRYEVNSVENAYAEKEETMRNIKTSAPQLEDKYNMLQRIRIYSRCLLECLNEKVEEVNGLVDERRRIGRERRERIEKRRRRDVKDSYEECAAAASAKNVNSVKSGDHLLRASDREARRARRRREREGKLSSIGHDEGLSSDDEETTSQNVADKEALDVVLESASNIFSDALPEYSSLKSVFLRILEWLATDSKSFKDSFVDICLPKLSSPFVRLELLSRDFLRTDVILCEMPWYDDVLRVADEGGLSLGQNPILISLIPSIIDKVILPYLTDVLVDEWEPLSLSQSSRVGAILRSLLNESPCLTERSKSLKRLLETIISKFNSLDDDLFVPMFGRQAMDSPSTGCRAFLDRQFWTAIKLLRCVSCMNGVLSSHSISQLHFSIANRVCVLSLQLVDMTEPHVILKTRALLKELSSSFPLGNVVQTRGLLGCLKKVAEEQKEKGPRDFHKELAKAIDVLEKINEPL